MARRKFVCGNWKMHKTAAEARALLVELRGLAEGMAEKVEVAVAPPFTALAATAEALRGSRMALAAQDVHWESQGAFTGEVSAPMLKEIGCAHVIVGHSERRQLFGETDEGVNKKARAVLSAGLAPIVCVGETLAEREARTATQAAGCDNRRSALSATRARSACQRKPRVLSARRVKWLLNLFPPWLVQGIQVLEMAPGFRRCRVRVRRSLLTGNLSGTTFGGTIFSAADPVHAVMYWQVFAHRGLRVQAWLRSASIRYLRPAASALTLESVLTDAEVDEAAEALASSGRHARTHLIEAFDAAGKLCATADVDVYLRLPREDQKTPSRGPAGRARFASTCDAGSRGSRSR